MKCELRGIHHNRTWDYGMKNNPWERMYTKKDSQNNSTLPKVDDAQKTLERMYEDNVLKRLPVNQPCASAAEALASIGPLSDEHTAALLKKKAAPGEEEKE